MFMVAIQTDDSKRFVTAETKPRSMYVESTDMYVVSAFISDT